MPTTVFVIFVIALAATVGLLWLWCLFDLWRRDSVPAILGSERLARLTWLLALIALAPFSIPLYFIFVMRGAFVASPTMRGISLGLGLLLSTWVVWGGRLAPNVPVLGAIAHADLGPVSAWVGGHNSGSWSSKAHDDSPLRRRTVRLVHQEDPIAAHYAESCARALSDSSRFAQVECVSTADGVSAKTAADCTVVLGYRSDVRLCIPLFTSLRTRFEARIVAGPGASGDGAEPLGIQAAGWEMQWYRSGDTQHFGFGCGRWPEAKVAAQSAQALAKEITDGIAEFPELPETQATPTPSAAEHSDPSVDSPPPIELQAWSPKRLWIENSPFLNTRSYTLLEADQTVDDASTSIQASFEDAGWQRLSPGAIVPGCFRYGRGRERIIVRSDLRPALDTGARGSIQPAKLLLIHEVWIGDEALRQLQESTCGASQHIGQWRAFEGVEGLHDTALRALTQPQSRRAADWMWLAQLHVDAGDIEGGRDALLTAHALRAMERSDKKQNERFAALAAAVDFDETTPPKPQRLVRLGLMYLDADSDHTITLAPGETARAFAAKDGAITKVEFTALGVVEAGRVKVRVENQRSMWSQVIVANTANDTGSVSHRYHHQDGSAILVEARTDGETVTLLVRVD